MDISSISSSVVAFCVVGFCCSPHQTWGRESREERRSLAERRGRDARDRLREREREYGGRRRLERRRRWWRTRRVMDLS
jgi:hypothetical protein